MKFINVLVFLADGIFVAVVKARSVVKRSIVRKGRTFLERDRKSVVQGKRKDRGRRRGKEGKWSIQSRLAGPARLAARSAGAPSATRRLASRKHFGYFDASK